VNYPAEYAKIVTPAEGRQENFGIDYEAGVPKLYAWTLRKKDVHFGKIRPS
jgi:hypothetical protein